MARRDPLRARSWRRLERRAVQAYERDLLRTVRQLITVAAPIDELKTDSAGIGTLELRLGDHHLTMGGIAASVPAQVTDAIAGDAPTVLSGAGRYNRSWWVHLASPAGSITVLAARLRLVAAHGGFDLYTEVTHGSPDGAGHGTLRRPLAQRQSG